MNDAIRTSNRETNISDLKTKALHNLYVFFFSTFIRIATILYYLNDVEEGGETAFVVADNSTLNESVRSSRDLRLGIITEIMNLGLLSPVA